MFTTCCSMEGEIVTKIPIIIIIRIVGIDRELCIKKTKKALGASIPHCLGSHTNSCDLQT